MKEQGGGNVVIESQKRRYESKLIIIFCLLFLFLFGVTAGSFGLVDDLPLEYSFFLFGLVNFNIVVLLLLSFLIFRNVVKLFSESPFGGNLRKRLVMAFLGFSIVPVIIIFVASVFYITTFIDRWSNPQLGKALRNAIDISSLYVDFLKEKNQSLARQIKGRLKEVDSDQITQFLRGVRKGYKIDAIELYRGQDLTFIAVSPELLSSDSLSEESIRMDSNEAERVWEEQRDSLDVYNLKGQRAVRFLTPMRFHNEKAVLVVTSLIPSVIHGHIGHIQATYGALQNDRSPLALIEPFYVVILVFVALVVLFFAIWLGLYLAKQWTTPLERLREAAKGLSIGKYGRVEFCKGYPEINLLISSFNEMVSKLETSQRETSEVNESLKKTLSQLDKHSRYIEIIISNVNAGVVSLDKAGKITMINHYASKLLQITPEKYLGHSLLEVLGEEARQMIDELVMMAKKYNSKIVEKEFEIIVKGRLIPLQVNLFFLSDELGAELGKVFVFNDLSVLIGAQRAAAWKEVAKRIAHEIKNPLTPIQLSAQRLQRKFGDQIEDPAFHDSVKMIMDQVEGLKSLVNEFSRFARLPQPRPSMASLNNVISGAMMLFIQSHKEVCFIQKLDEFLPDFLFDSEHMKRVVTNLVDNSLFAIHGFSEKPEITVLTEYDKLLNIVRVSVSDNGPGFPPEIMGKMFDPDITTKKSGTGLGLAIVRRLVEEHHGLVTAFNMKPRGARMVVEIPVVLSTREIKPLGRPMVRGIQDRPSLSI